MELKHEKGYTVIAVDDIPRNKDMKCIYEDQIIVSQRKKTTHMRPGRLTNGETAVMDLQVDHTLNIPPSNFEGEEGF